MELLDYGVIDTLRVFLYPLPIAFWGWSTDVQCPTQPPATPYSPAGTMMFEAYTQKTQRMIYWKLEAAEMRALVNSCGAQRLKPTLEMPHLDLDSVLPTWAVTHCGFFFCVQICTKTYHSLQQVIWWLWMNLQCRYLRGGLVGKEICPQWELSGWLTLQTGHRQLDFHTRCLPFLYSADSIITPTCAGTYLRCLGHSCRWHSVPGLEVLAPHLERKN